MSKGTCAGIVHWNALHSTRELNLPGKSDSVARQLRIHPLFALSAALGITSSHKEAVLCQTSWTAVQSLLLQHKHSLELLRPAQVRSRRNRRL